MAMHGQAGTVIVLQCHGELKNVRCKQVKQDDMISTETCLYERRVSLGNKIELGSMCCLEEIYSSEVKECIYILLSREAILVYSILVNSAFMLSL